MGQVGAGSVGQGPAEAHAAPGVEVGGVRDRQRRPVSEGSEQVVGEADVVHQGAEVRLEGAGLGGDGRAAERVVDGLRARRAGPGDEVRRDVVPGEQAQMIHERQLVGVVHLDGQVDQLGRAVVEQFDEPLDGRVVELHVAALQDAVAAGGDERVGIREARDERLLAEHVEAGGQGLEAGGQVRRVRHRDDDGVQAQAPPPRPACPRRGGRRSGRPRPFRTVAEGSTTATKLEAGAVVGQRDRVRGLADESRTDQSDPQADRPPLVHGVPRPSDHLRPAAGPRVPLCVNHTLERSD